MDAKIKTILERKFDSTEIKHRAGQAGQMWTYISGVQVMRRLRERRGIRSAEVYERTEIQPLHRLCLGGGILQSIPDLIAPCQDCALRGAYPHDREEESG